MGVTPVNSSVRVAIQCLNRYLRSQGELPWAMGPSSTEVKQQLWPDSDFRDVKIREAEKGEAR